MNLILATSLVDLPVVDRKNKKYGTVFSTLVDTGNGSLVGLMVKTHFLSPTLFVNFEDIDDFYHSHILLKTPDDIQPIKKNQKAYELSRHGGKLIGLPVITESGKKLGKLEDMAVSIQYGAVARIYIRHLFSNRILDRDKIVEITKKKVIVIDDAANLDLPITEPANS